MKIIINNKENEFIINKSRFIGIIKKINTKEEADNEIKNARLTHPMANHVCYAYILPNTEKYSDDKEPDGTAGKPILDVLKKNDLSYVVAIVIRYFGGIKLGSNGLIRAYSNTISKLVNDNIKDKEIGYLIRIEENYTNSEQLNYLLKEENIIKKDYQEKIVIEVIVKKKTLEKLSNVHYQILDEIII